MDNDSIHSVCDSNEVDTIPLNERPKCVRSIEFGDIILAGLVAVAVILLSLGFTGNIIAYSYDNGMDTVTLTFNDTSTETMIDGDNYSLTINQTSITTFTVYTDYIIYTYDPNVVIDVWLMVNE